MAKSSTKPVAKLIIIAYFIPFLISFLFENSTPKDKIGFALSTVAVSLCALILYLSLKKWEADFRSLLLQKRKEEEPKTITPPEMIAAPYIAEIEAKEKLLKERSEAVLQLRDEKEQMVAEKKLALDEKEERAKKLKLEIEEMGQLLQKAQSELLESKLQAKIQEEVIGKLNQDVANLNFELKTVLKVVTKKT